MQLFAPSMITGKQPPIGLTVVRRLSEFMAKIQRIDASTIDGFLQWRSNTDGWHLGNDRLTDSGLIREGIYLRDLHPISAAWEVMMRFWDIQILEQGEGEETIQGLTGTQKIKLMGVFERYGISAKAVQLNEKREPTGEKDTTSN